MVFLLLTRIVSLCANFDDRVGAIGGCGGGLDNKVKWEGRNRGREFRKKKDKREVGGGSVFQERRPTKGGGVR